MILVVMGVSGVGKTTVGKILSQQTGWPFYDADDFHSPENVAKMRSGIALTDADRWPWLDRLNALLRDADQRGQSAVLACSALKQKYRDRLARELREIRWVHLEGSFELIKARLDARKGHYMTAQLLQSQFAALEPPINALRIEVTGDPATMARDILATLPAPRPGLPT